MQTMHQAQWLNQRPEQRELFFEMKEARGVSRRDFLRLAGLAGIATGAGALLPRQAFAKDPSGGKSGGSPDTVAIIGCGISGLTAAYRLHLAGIPCEIFEVSERTGGRMFTHYDFNKDGMFCELGGELVDSDHADLIALAGELGVEIQELKADDKGVDLYFFNGKHYTDEQLIPLFQPLAKKIEAVQDEIYDKEDLIVEKAVKYDKMSLAQYFDSVSDGVEKWVIEMLKVAYIIENGRELDEQSALNFVTYIDPKTTDGFKLFGESDESKRIKGGSSALANAVLKAIEGKVKIHKGWRLAKIADSKSNIGLTFATSGGSKAVNFGRVICSIPFTMLRQVEGVKTLGLSPEKTESIEKLGYGTNVKVMLGFTDRWWRNPAAKLPELSNGSIFTDLPFQCTWETSRGQEGTSGILTNYLGGNAGKQITGDRFDKITDELNRVFPGIRDKFDGKRAMMNWPEYRYVKGSYTCPLVGQYTTLLDAAGTTELDGRLLFAGEHTSADFSGFMNGGIESGNKAAAALVSPQAAEVKAE